MIKKLYQYYLSHPVISTDSRNITKGCIFFALKGERFNGNKYAVNAIEQGAAYAVIDEIEYKNHERCLLVEDGLKTLQAFANHHRKQLGIPVIGITGSNGKTTTKELVSRVLATQFKTASTKGNFNNHIGVPLTLLSIPTDTEIAVVEMGANHQKEIELLCGIAEPTHGIITNIGKAHLEGFGGVEGVKKGKAELYDFLAKTKGIAFINTEQSFLNELAKERGVKKIYKYGQDGRLKYHSKLKKEHPSITIDFEDEQEQEVTLNSPLFGKYNFYNINTAIAIGKHFGIETQNIIKAIENYHPKNNRSQIVVYQTNTVFLDAYNANPTSTKNAVELFSKLEANRKVVILGDMLELGEESSKEHEAMMDYVLTLSFDLVLLVGKEYGKIEMKGNCQHFAKVEDLKTWWESLPTTQQIKNAHLLVKGSRGIRLEKLLK